MSQKTRINVYLDSEIGESFKRYCKSRKRSYSDVIEALIYRFLISPQSSNSHSESSNLTTIQSQIHDDAVHAYRQVYESQRQSIIDSAVSESGSESVEDVSPRIPMPMPTPSSQGGDRRGIRTNHLSKRDRG